MIWKDELLTAGESLVSSPKLTALAAGTTTTLGIANLAEIFQGALSTIGIIAGILATILLSRKHWIDYKNGLVQNKILTAQLEAMGAEPLIEKKHDA